MKVKSLVSLETGETLREKALKVIASKDLKWKKRTQYERDRYLKIRYFDNYDLGMQSLGSETIYYHLISKDDKYYCNIPYYIGQSLIGIEIVTFVLGPFMFTNGFEKTDEGQFVIRITPYYIMDTMKEDVVAKLKDILKKYGTWIHKDDSFKCIQETIVDNIKDRDYHIRNLNCRIEDEKDKKYKIAFDKDVQYGKLQEQYDDLQKTCDEIKRDYMIMEKNYTKLKRLLHLET